MDTLRLLIAVHCQAPSPIAEVLQRLDALRPTVKPVREDHLHVTLRFLGNVRVGRLDALTQAVELAVQAAAVEPFDLRLAQLGRFPVHPGKTPRVIYAEPANPEPLHRLAQTLDEALMALEPAIEPDERPFSAHLTLARVKLSPRAQRRRTPRYLRQRYGGDSPLEALATLIESHREVSLGSTRIESVRLIASTLTELGPEYVTRHEVPLTTP